MFRGVAHGNGALAEQVFFHIFLSEDAHNFAVELLHDIFGCAQGRHDANPRIGFVARHATFRQGGNIGQGAQAFGAANGNGIEPALLHKVQHRRNAAVEQLHLARQQVGGGGALPFVGHVRGVDLS